MLPYYYQVTTTNSYCKCAEGYQAKPNDDMLDCVQQQPTSNVSTIHITPLASLALALVVLAALLCFVTRLFARARWAPAR